MVIVELPSEMIEIAATYNENISNDSVGLKYILIKRMEINKIPI
jgi:hypothetical protein